MLQQYFLPLPDQFDDGFGAVADGFRDAAKALDSSGDHNGFGLAFTKLPIYFLYRHAIELFLKGIILILHRRFHPDYPHGGSDSNPTIQDGTKQRQIYQVHDLLLLYTTFKSQIAANDAGIRANAITDWTAIHPDLDGWITDINDADSRSTMFRYPVTSDAQLDKDKSSFKQAVPSDVVTALNDDSTPPQFVFAIKNDENEIVNTYMHDRDPMANVVDSLNSCAELLSGTHYGLLADLVFQIGRPASQSGESGGI